MSEFFIIVIHANRLKLASEIADKGLFEVTDVVTLWGIHATVAQHACLQSSMSACLLQILLFI